MKSKKPFYFTVLAGILLFGIFVLISWNQKTAAIEEIPNLTDVKDPVVVDGFKYEKQPHLGDPKAKVKVIEFADFKCPACKYWEHENFAKFKKEFIDTGKVELYFMNFAFIDRDSYLAAYAGEAIAKQSNEKFWEYYHKLYQNQGKENKVWATEEFISKFVKGNIIGINYEQFATDLKNHTYLYEVKEDFKIGGYYGVNGTPTFIVNGKVQRSMDYEVIKTAIEQELK